MKINPNYINEYKHILETTNLQRSYQEFIKFFRGLRTYLAENLSEYKFTGNIVENNMDYSYFQFTNKELQALGLKFVFAFTHNTFEYELWLSGLNRNIQKKYHENLSNIKHQFVMSPSPTRFDYILKEQIPLKLKSVNSEVIYENTKEKVLDTTEIILKLLQENGH